MGRRIQAEFVRTSDASEELLTTIVIVIGVRAKHTSVIRGGRFGSGFGPMESSDGDVQRMSVGDRVCCDGATNLRRCFTRLVVWAAGKAGAHEVGPKGRAVFSDGTREDNKVESWFEVERHNGGGFRHGCSDLFRVMVFVLKTETKRFCGKHHFLTCKKSEPR